jgi:hypothetical protein
MTSHALANTELPLVKLVVSPCRTAAEPISREKETVPGKEKPATTGTARALPDGARRRRRERMEGGTTLGSG